MEVACARIQIPFRKDRVIRTVTSADEVREDQPASTFHLLSIQERVNPPSGLGLTVRSRYSRLDETTNSLVRTSGPDASDHEASKIKVHIYTLFQ